MSDKRTSRALAAALALLLVFAAFGCQKLSVKKLTANYHFNKANALFIDNKYSKAIAEYKTALESNPELVDAYRFLGESYKALYVPAKETAENKERADEALKALQKAFDVDPNNKDVIYSLGDMFDKLRDFEKRREDVPADHRPGTRQHEQLLHHRRVLQALRLGEERAQDQGGADVHPAHRDGPRKRPGLRLHGQLLRPAEPDRVQGQVRQRPGLPPDAREARARLGRDLLHHRRQPVQQGLPAAELPLGRREGSPPPPMPRRTCSRPSRSTPTSRTPTPT